MSYDTEIVKICRLVNGYEVEIYDPPKEQPKPKKDMHTAMPYSPPWKAYAFSTEQEVFKFLKDKMPSLRRKSADDEYADSFKEATK